MTGTGSSAAWLARHVRDVEAGGSNPPFPTEKPQATVRWTESLIKNTSVVLILSRFGFEDHWKWPRTDAPFSITSAHRPSISSLDAARPTISSCRMCRRASSATSSRIAVSRRGVSRTASPVRDQRVRTSRADLAGSHVSLDRVNQSDMTAYSNSGSRFSKRPATAPNAWAICVTAVPSM